MPNTTFIIHAYDDVEPIDIGATFGVLSMAKRVDPGIDMILVANKAGPVRLSNGLEIIAPYSVTNCPAGDVLMILGGAAWPEVSKDEQTLDFIRTFAQKGIVASVCTGALILAGAGLLDGKGVSYTEHDASFSPELRREMIAKANGRATFPQIFVGDVHVGGSDDLHALDRTGRLDQLLATGNLD